MATAEDKSKPFVDPQRRADSKLRRLFRSAADVETLIDAAEGEITPEVEQAIESFLADEAKALDALLDYREENAAVKAACKAKIEQCQAVVDKVDRDTLWVDEQLKKLAERKLKGSKRRSFRHGERTVRLNTQPEFVAVDPDLDPTTLPTYLRKWSEPKEPVCSIDKKAAKKALQDGEQIPGMRLARKAPKIEVE